MNTLIKIIDAAAWLAFDEAERETNEEQEKRYYKIQIKLEEIIEEIKKGA